MDTENVKTTLREMIDKTEDAYEQFRYSDELYMRVGSPNDQKGTFEIEVIVPHDAVDISVGRDSPTQLPLEIPTAEDFYDDIDEIIVDVTGDYKSFTFVKIEVVDDGTFKEDATVYTSHTLKE